MKKSELKELIYKNVSILDVLNAYSPRKISHGMCNCPIHNEDVPSCKINKNNTFYCFACGAHGDMIQLAQGVLNLTFLQTMEKIALDFGLKTELSEEEHSIISDRQREMLQKKAQEIANKKKILRYSDAISNRLMELRKQCYVWYNDDFISTEEMDKYIETKDQIKELENIYMQINNLYPKDEYDIVNHVIAEKKDFLKFLKIY